RRGASRGSPLAGRASGGRPRLRRGARPCGARALPAGASARVARCRQCRLGGSRLRRGGASRSRLHGARDRLVGGGAGGRGGPGAVAGDSCAGESTCAPLELAAELLSWDPGEAERVLVRWVEARGGTKDPPDGARTPWGLLAAARLAYAAGRPSIGIRSARLALEAARRSDPSLAWGVEPWLYPPAFDSLVRALVPDSRGPEGALIRA